MEPYYIPEDEKLYFRPCPRCSNTDIHHALITNEDHVCPGMVSIVRCPKCGLGRQIKIDSKTRYKALDFDQTIRLIANACADWNSFEYHRKYL